MNKENIYESESMGRCTPLMLAGLENIIYACNICSGKGKQITWSIDCASIRWKVYVNISDQHRLVVVVV